MDKQINYSIGKSLLNKKAFHKQTRTKGAPYNFVTFPALPKIVLYRDGINQVEQEDLYAALLCSEHYKRFLVNNTSKEAQRFVREEEKRQERIIEKLPDFEMELFDFHYGLVQLGDNISLYICLNEPGVAKEDEHDFFKEGIPLASALELTEKMYLQWLDRTTIQVDPFPFNQPLSFQLKQKKIVKKDILKDGLLDTYHKTPYEELTLQLVAKE